MAVVSLFRNNESIFPSCPLVEVQVMVRQIIKVSFVNLRIIRLGLRGHRPLTKNDAWKVKIVKGLIHPRFKRGPHFKWGSSSPRSSQFDHRNLRKDANPAGIAQETKAPVYIKLLILKFIKTSPLLIHVLNRAPFDPW